MNDFRERLDAELSSVRASEASRVRLRAALSASRRGVGQAPGRVPGQRRRPGRWAVPVAVAALVAGVVVVPLALDRGSDERPVPPASSATSPSVVTPPPTTATPSPTTSPVASVDGLTVTILTSDGEPFPASSVDWGDGVTAKATPTCSVGDRAATTHRYARAGTYAVTLLGLGCDAGDSTTVRVSVDSVRASTAPEATPSLSTTRTLAPPLATTRGTTTPTPARAS